MPAALDAAPIRCRYCGGALSGARVQVAGNTRAVAGRMFTVARCTACRSINAVEPQDLDALYADYPLHAPARGFAAFGFDRAFAARARRLAAAGVSRGARVLDYGGGRGRFAALLRRRGYRASDYDPAFDAPPPSGLFDAVTCQDVVEHVEDPRALMRAMAARLRPGGILMLGAPLADGLDLGASDRWIMHLHQPYHRAIPSEAAVGALAAEAGLVVEAFERRFAGQSWWPGLNAPFVEAYGRACGGIMEHTLDGARPGAVVREPALIALALFGAALPAPSNFAAVLRRPRAAGVVADHP